LEECKFPPQIIQIFLHSISSSSYKIMWNNDKTDIFNPSRGISQGDNLSTYFFVIFMDRLTHMIAYHIETDYWVLMRVGRYGSQISHLLLLLISFFCWSLFFFCGGRGLNPRPCIYYALSILTKLSSRGLLSGPLLKRIIV
jgi:hypothetical protein